jgi:hypothetical protein
MLISRLVKESQVARTQLAKDAGLSYAALHAWIVGARRPRPESLHQLAAGFRRRAEVLQEFAAQLDGAAEKEGGENG